MDVAAANKLNQYTTVDAATYGYDANGNLTSDGVYTYEYDPQNRLLAVKLAGTAVVSYNYDALGRRISKTVGASTVRYCYDGDQVIAEYDGLGTLLRKFIYGPGIDEPICMIVPGSPAVTYFYHQDALGSVVALSKFDSGSASFVEKYSYSAFGQTTVCDGSGNPRTLNQSAFDNPYMFTGREYETLDSNNLKLYYYRARFYKPEIGRFLQTDPIGYSDSMNLYQYCGNNPIRFTDPFGLKFLLPYNDPQAMAAWNKAITYLCKSTTFQRVYSTLENSDWEFNVGVYAARIKPRPLVDTSEFNPFAGVAGMSSITWKYDIAAVVGNGRVQSPALGLAHEMIHAFRWWRGESMPILINPNSNWGGWGKVEERETILGLEAIIAKELGEYQRFNYDNSTPMKVSGPTSTKRCE